MLSKSALAALAIHLGLGFQASLLHSFNSVSMPVFFALRCPALFSFVPGPKTLDYPLTMSRQRVGVTNERDYWRKQPWLLKNSIA
jgi:hypothetical protein